MTGQNADLQRLLDRAAIRDLHVRYFRGVDLGDEAVVRSCFDPGIIASYHSRDTVHGIDALIKSMPNFPKQKSGEWRISTHFMGNLEFRRLEGDEAETETHAFAFLVLTIPSPDHLAMRSLRYIDRLRRREGDWRVVRRLHTLDWACEVPTTFATQLSLRKATPPA